MIERANTLNQFADRCRYHVNDRDDLALFPDGVFDLIYSDIVLQHIAPEFGAGYVQEFARVLAPGGVVVFQLPSHLLGSDEKGMRPQSIADDAFRAEIVPADKTLEIEAGAIDKIAVSVRNASTAPWPDDRFVNLGNHWRHANGEVERLDDGRASMYRTVGPGDTIDLTLEMQAPNETGAYLLELDLVIEGVAWFADRGSPTVTIPVQVVPRTVVREEADAPIVPVMEMHGIPRAEVEAMLRAKRLDIVMVQETDKAAGWRDFWYVAVKPDPTARPRRRARESVPPTLSRRAFSPGRRAAGAGACPSGSGRRRPRATPEVPRERRPRSRSARSTDAGRAGAQPAPTRTTRRPGACRRYCGARRAGLPRSRCAR